MPTPQAFDSSQTYLDWSSQDINMADFSYPGLFQNPWTGGVDMAWSDANVARHNFATQTVINQPVNPIRQPTQEPYVRIVSKGRIIYRHATAGQILGKGRTRWEVERDQNNERRGGNPWAMWGSKDEWEAAKWMATTKVSQASINKLLKTERYRGANYSFKTAKALFKKIRTEMAGFGGPEWNVVDVTVAGAPKDKATLFWRGLKDTADFQFGRPWFAGKMATAPERHYDSEELERLYENPWTADDWNERQKTLPVGTTYGGILLASDSTLLSTHSGDVEAHAVYMSLANLDKSVRASTSENAWVLVAYIPKSKFEHAMATLEDRPKDVRTKIRGVLNRRLFHRCMEIITRDLRRTKPHDVVDPEGNIRSVLYELTAYIADLEEQWLVAGLGAQTCPHCESHTTCLGNPEYNPPRTPTDVLQKIKHIKTQYRADWGRDISLEEFVNRANEEHLNGVDKPFWQSLPNLNIFNALSPDLLHGFHKQFYDHIYRFNRNGMGALEYDARVRSQIHFSGDRAFLRGVSHISQMTGIEHRLLERSHLAVVANAPGGINVKVIKATRAMMDMIYLAQLPTQSERSLKAYKEAHELFTANRQAWIDNGTRCGKNGVIEHFNIPKMHVIRHLAEHIQRKGSPDNYTTDTTEHLHTDVKDAYRASNRREWKEQTVRWLTRHERMRDFEAWMDWCKTEERRESEQSNLESEQTQRPEVETETNVSSDSDSSRDAQTLVVGGGSEQDEEEWEGETNGDDDRDPDEYGERLEERDEEGVSQCEAEARADMVRRWLLDQPTAVDNSGSRKRKRPTDSDDRNPRSRPRPRFESTHALTELQSINRKPSDRRKSIQQICETYKLDVTELMREIELSPHLSALPISIDEYTLIDVWQALRTHLPSTAYRSNVKMQRIRSRPAARGHAAKNDPVLYVSAEGKTAQTAGIHDATDLPAVPKHGSPQPTLNDVPSNVQEDPPIPVQHHRAIRHSESRHAKAAPHSASFRDSAFMSISTGYCRSCASRRESRQCDGPIFFVLFEQVP
ncbi:hypothetical protein RhiJN_00048 [Ceratobasidium sp. AG-Ba]|nr:hypothetical protein RhiJN_00048 [Ceratobasidium sp. AG-Ba]QRW01091.1 hypothetical protein RhiLY_00088 [Ceratobasidium sp. AG-Ba]